MTTTMVDLQKLVTLPGEEEITLDMSLEFALLELAMGEKRLMLVQDNLENAKSGLLEFQRIARGGAPRVATTDTAA
jgi:hypothetical protein